MKLSLKYSTKKLILTSFIILPIVNLILVVVIGLFMASGEQFSDLFPSDWDGLKAFDISLFIMMFFYFPFLLVQFLWLIIMWCKVFLAKQE